MLRDRHKARPEAGGREVVLHLSVRGEGQAGPELLKYFCPSQSFLSECGLQVGKGVRSAVGCTDGGGRENSPEADLYQ